MKNIMVLGLSFAFFTLFATSQADAALMCCPPQDKCSGEKVDKCNPQEKCQVKDKCSGCPEGWSEKNQWWKVGN